MATSSATATAAASAAAASGGAAALQPKQGLELSVTSGAGAGVQLPLTIISTAPRCQAAAVVNSTEAAQLPMTVGVAASPATRCCALLSGGNAEAASALGYAYDAYTMGGLTGSLGRRMLPTHYTTGACDDFVGVETLDILQGLAAGKRGGKQKYIL